ncbi:hypothetical protein BDR07DRAFT_1410938, partial [Suillus spraguei]
CVGLALPVTCHMSRFCDESVVTKSKPWTSLSLAMITTIVLALTRTFYQGFIIDQHQYLYGNEREASQYINGDIRTMGKQARLQPSVNTILQLDFSLLPAISTVPWGT